MQLKSLEMQGFKSFPDKTILHFNRGITAVVGPNGSGKSNISDAVRWVLGEQSTKSLRGVKMEDIIFGGTAERKAQGYAQVSLVLEDSAHRYDPDTTELVVARRYYRSGESEYMLNHKLVRLKDVHELFMDTGLGRDGYSIIGQGKVADIISSKSEERREIFEEAAGIAKYRYRKNTAQNRLQHAEENLLRLQDIVSELESRVEPLREQSEKASRFLELAAQKKEIEISLWVNLIESYKDELNAQEAKIRTAAGQYEQTEAALAAMETRMEETLAAMESHTIALEDLHRQSAALEEKASTNEAEAAVLENTILHNNQTIERIQRDRQTAQDTTEHLEEEIGKRQTEIADVETQIAEKQAELTQAAQGLARIHAQDEGANATFTELSKSLSQALIQLSATQAGAASAEASLQELSERLTHLEGSYQQRQTQKQEAELAKTAADEQLTTCNTVFEELQNSLKGYERRLEIRRQKEVERKQQVEALSAKAQQQLHKAKVLEELEQNMEGYAYSVKAVTKAQKNGVLAGIHGPISQLIHLESQYAVAIETALGGALQNIVTGSEQDGKRAIEWLKGQNAGRATFLPLTNIKANPLREPAVAKEPGFIATADRLVSFDPQYEAVISSLLGRIVVADQLDHAIAIAKRFQYRFRIVTLDGQVLHAGGSMTGGSVAKSAGILSRVNEIEKLRADASATGAALTEAQQALRTAVEETARANADYQGAQGDLTRANEAKIAAEGEVRLHREKLQALTLNLQEAEAQRSQAQARTTELAAQREQAQQDTERLNAFIREREAELAELSSSREHLVQEKESLSALSSQIHIHILTANKDIEALRDAIMALERRKTGHAGRVIQIEEEITQIELHNREIAGQAAQLREEALLRLAEAQGVKGKIAQTIAARAALEQQNTKLRTEEREKNAEHEALSGELARLNERRENMLKTYDETINKLYDEYELTRSEAQAIAVPIPDPPKAQRKLNELKNQIRNLGNVNVAAIEEYKEVSERYTFMTEQISDIERSKEELIRMIDELTQKMQAIFQIKFVEINQHFNTIFGELFSGGNAQLTLQDENDLLNTGIDIKIQPPGKNVQNIDLFSGGEKVLAAIALLFAILRVNPAPFCIFDEIEAALDDVNVDRFAQYLRRMADNTQIIAITHRRGTMEEADMLYGVTMQEEGISKLLELHTAEMVQKLGIKAV